MDGYKGGQQPKRVWMNCLKEDMHKMMNSAIFSTFACIEVTKK